MSDEAQKQKIRTLENHAGSPGDGSTAKPAENHAGSVAEGETTKPLENHAGSIGQDILKTDENHAGSEQA
ncbi:hypothetical protein ACFW20_01305 [Streptomyces nigra]|uniref:hypothetical protein n=1 Tax=Streptomyces nigra TaxID=1827580 RepID=UPI0030D1BFC7